MSAFSVNPASGSGSLDLGSQIAIVDVYSELLTDGFFVERRMGVIEAVYKVGWYGFGNTAASSFSPFMCWWKYVDFAVEDFFDPVTSLLTYADTFFWALSPGTEMRFEINT